MSKYSSSEPAKIAAGEVANQTWFWAEESQVGERQADSERDSGDGTRLDSGDALLASLAD